MGTTMLVTSLEWRVVVLGECMCRNLWSASAWSWGHDGDVKQELAVPRQQLCFSSCLEGLLAELQQ